MQNDMYKRVISIRKGHSKDRLLIEIDALKNENIQLKKELRKAESSICNKLKNILFKRGQING